VRIFWLAVLIAIPVAALMIISGRWDLLFWMLLLICLEAAVHWFVWMIQSEDKKERDYKSLE
jgi:hypothetical protein